MKNIRQKIAEGIMISAAIGWGTCLVVLIGIIGLARACIADEPDPMDNSINKTQEIVELLKIVDSTGNGFRVHYATVNRVTQERYDEILSRKEIKDTYRRLQKEAPLHFGGSLLETDIYDFATFAKGYDVSPDVHIDCIFVTGPEKSAFYAQPNPDLPDGATWINPLTEQGLQWISHKDIYYRMGKGSRIYRYWKCPGIREISTSDERFTHFTKQEKVD